MSIVSKVKKGLRLLYDSNFRWTYLSGQGLYDSWDDERYIKKYFECTMGKRLDLENPKTFNEKLQWLKLHDRNPEYVKMVDKYLAKEYVAGIIGKEYIIPTLGVWDRAEDIDFEELPNKFVLKCNHNSGLGMCICKDKSKLDIPRTRALLNKGLAQNYYLHGREWPYKDVKRRIIAEQYMEDNPDSKELTDYKFYCFNGVVDSVMVCCDRQSGDTKFYFFDKEWCLKRYNVRGINAPPNFTFPKPNNIDEMFLIAKKLSKGLPFARVDLYSINQRTYFGEITFYPQSGYDKNLLTATDILWGNMINLDGCKRSCAQ